MRAAAVAAALLVLAATTTFGRAAHADGEADAKDLFTRARTLRAAGDCSRAAPLFARAYAVYPSGLGSLRNLAECDEALARWASARRAWLDLGRALLVEHDPKYAGWAAEATAAAGRVAPRVAHLVVRLDLEGIKAEDVDVAVNGETIAAALVGTTLDRDPGAYDVRARPHTLATAGDDAARGAQESVQLAAGETKTVHLRLTAPAAPRNAASPPGRREREGQRDDLAAVPDAPRASSPWPIVGWIGVGIGAAALVGSGIALGVRQDALSTLESACPSYATLPCPASLRPVVDRGSTASMLTTVLGVAGGVLAAAGVVMIVAGGGGHTPSARPALVVSPTRVALAWRFR